MFIKIMPKCYKCGHRLIQHLVGPTQISADPAGNPTVELRIDSNCPGCEAAKKCVRHVPPAGTAIEIREGRKGRSGHRTLYCAGKRGSFYDGQRRIKASSDFCTALEGRGTEYACWRLPCEDKWSE